MFTGLGEWLVLASVIIVLMGARKLPALGRALADSVQSFKKGLRGDPRPSREVKEVEPPKKS